MREDAFTHNPYEPPQGGDGLESFSSESPAQAKHEDGPTADWFDAFSDEGPAESLRPSSATANFYDEVIVIDQPRSPVKRAAEARAAVPGSRTRHIVHALTSLPGRTATITLIAVTVSAAPLVLAGRAVERPQATIINRGARAVTPPPAVSLPPFLSETQLISTTTPGVPIASPVQASAASSAVPKPDSVIDRTPIRRPAVMASDPPAIVAPRTSPSPTSQATSLDLFALPTPEASLTPTPPPTLTPTSTSPPAAPPVTPVPTPAVTPTRREVETAEIQTLLGRYRHAFGALDVSAIDAFWPTVNRKVLSNAFEQLETQTFVFDSCSIEIAGEQAEASCAGRANFTTKVGSRTPHVESRRWLFRLARISSSWMILSVESR